MAARKFVVLIVSLTCSMIHTVTGASYTVSPVDSTSAIGATTRFLCTVTIDKTIGEEVYWHFEPSAVNSEDVATIGPYTNKNPTAFPRYEITGVSVNGVYNFEIMNTQKTDEGTYSCLIVRRSVTEMRSAMLTVQDNNSRPMNGATCDDGSLTNSHIEGDTVTISCMISGGVPLPILQIVRNRESIVSHEVIQSSTTILSSNTVRETATFTVSHVDHNAVYRCLVLYPERTEDAMLSCDFSRNPQVEFVPVVTINPSDVYIEGNDDNQEVILTCDAIANPPPTPVQWQYDNNKLTSGVIDGNKLTFNGVKESYVGETITCSTSNSRGTGSISIILQESDRLLPFDTYILLIIIAGACLLLFLLTCVCICCCCQNERDGSIDGDKDVGYHVNESRPTSMRHNNDDDIIDGYDADNFTGGSEANLIREESHKSRASSRKSRASQRSGFSDRTDNRSSVRSNAYVNEENTFENQAYSPDGSTGNNDVEFNTPLY